MRNAREIVHRLRQELKNAALLLRPPTEPGELGQPPTALQDCAAAAAALRDTDYAREICRIAAEIRGHRLPLLGLTIDTGPQIHWRRDYVSGKETKIGRAHV